MNDQELMKALIERATTTDQGYFQSTHIIACILPKHLHESLEQLVNGPVHDGDVISKAHRDELIELGLATRVCCKGEQGYTGGKYIAYTVAKAVRAIKEGKLAA